MVYGGVKRGSWRSALAVLAAACMLGGCSGPVKQDIEVAGPGLSAAGRPALDITNRNGSVRVEVDPRLTQPVVQAKVRSASDSELKPKEAAEHVWVAAETVNEGGRQILRVLAEPKEGAPESPRIQLLIKIPPTSGVIVRNAGGPVELVGVGGPIEVENGIGGGPGGRIEVRTDEIMTYPVTLTTTDGAVFYQVPPASTGRFDILSEEGKARFVAEGGTVSDIQAAEDHWVGTLNRGDNPVILRSRSGYVRAMVRRDPIAYVPNRYGE